MLETGAIPDSGRTTMNSIAISAVAFPEDGVWVVQGIEFDICTHAKSPADLPAAFARAIVENACINQHLGREGLEGIKPAPDRFREMFDHAHAEIAAVGDLPNVPVPVGAIRLAA